MPYHCGLHCLSAVPHDACHIQTASAKKIDRLLLETVDRLHAERVLQGERHTAYASDGGIGVGMGCINGRPKLSICKQRIRTQSCPPRTKG
eukprot:1161686-Pelagomonas_calceolata.AAC.7